MISSVGALSRVFLLSSLVNPACLSSRGVCFRLILAHSSVEHLWWVVFLPSHLWLFQSMGFWVQMVRDECLGPRWVTIMHLKLFGSILFSVTDGVGGKNDESIRWVKGYYISWWTQKHWGILNSWLATPIVFPFEVLSRRALRFVICFLNVYRIFKIFTFSTIFFKFLEKIELLFFIFQNLDY